MNLILASAKLSLKPDQYRKVKEIFDAYYNQEPNGRAFLINKWSNMPEMVSILRNSDRHGEINLKNQDFQIILETMLLDRNKYTESGYIGEELIGDATIQLEQRCLAVQHSISDKAFSSYAETLAAYHVSDAEYKLFIGKAVITNIFISFTGTTLPLNKKDFLEIYECMLLTYFPLPSDRVKSIAKKIEQEANEIA